MTQPLLSGRLTKQFFMGLPTGVYLVSGVGDAPDKPDFAENTAPMEARATQWRRIVDARVNNRQCNVFQTSAEFLSFVLEIRNYPGRN